MKLISVEYNNYFLLFLALACVSGIGAFFVPALLCIIIYYMKNRSEFKQDIFSIAKFKTIILFMALFLGSLLVSWSITGGIEGLKLVKNNFERMLPFIFVIIGLSSKGNLNEKLKYLLYGTCFGVLIVCFSVLDKIFIDGLYRPLSLLGSVNILGGTLIFVLPFIVVLTWNLWKQNNIYLFSIITIVLLLFTLIFIKSRGSWFGLFVILSVLPLIIYKMKKITFSKVFVIELILFLCVVFAYFIFQDSFHRGYDFERPALREISWHMFLANPIGGIGAGNFISTYVNEEYISPLVNSKHILKHAHNIYFKFLSENGIVGFGGFLILILYQLKILWNSIIKKQNNLSLSVFLAIIGMLAHGWFDVCFSARYYAMTYWLLFGVATYFIFVETKDVNKLCKF